MPVVARNRPSDSCLDGRHDRRRLGELAALLDHLDAVHPDRELARISDDERGIGAELSLEVRCRPGSVRLVASGSAVADLDRHASSILLTARHGTLAAWRASGPCSRT
jgi:hypothetical protein